MFEVKVENVTKTYANNVKALKQVDLSVAAGDFFGLLGPNGAGKTTLIGIVTSLVNKTSGSVSIFGHDLDKDIPFYKCTIEQFYDSDVWTAYDPMNADLWEQHANKGSYSTSLLKKDDND